MSSTAKSASAVLDWPYASHLSYFDVSKLGSSNLMPVRRWPSEDSVTTRAPFTNAGARRQARSMWPRWLVPNCDSTLPMMRRSGVAMMPALLIRMCNGDFVARNESAKLRTLFQSARSMSAISTASLPVDLRMSSAAASALARERTGRMTRAPADASARAVSIPMPEEPPVTMAVLPFRSIPLTTSPACVP